MPILLLLFILTGLLYAALKKITYGNFSSASHKYEEVKNEYDRVNLQKSELINANVCLKKNLEETIALYDITKEICKPLDEDKVFKSFLEQIDNYLELKTCLFFKGDVNLSQYKDSVIVPLEIHKVAVGYLVAGGIKEEDREKFNILAQQFLLGIKRAILYQKIQELAITDTLTGVFTRKHYLERLEGEIEYAKKNNYSLAFLMLDIDHFKECNDRYGHLVGDAILKEVSKIIKENLRQIDLVGRYGGEEFSIILTQTDKEGAAFAAERILRAVESQHFRVYDEDLKVTLSIGVVLFPADAQLAPQIIEKADKSLYKAKELGRNRVCFT